MITLYGIGCVFLLVTATFLSNLTGTLGHCRWLLIGTVLLTPLTWFGTPKDSWHVSVLSLGSIGIVAMLIVYQARKEAWDGTVR